MKVAVFGAYGHTGRFVVAELAARGHEPVLYGRDRSRLTAVAGGFEARVASVDDLVLTGVDAVINTAGPFATTAGPVIEAALRAEVPYVDVAAEIEANADTFARFAGRGGVIVPAMAFFGGLGDLLATAALGDWQAADEVHVAYGLSSWQPTAGTVAAGAVSSARRGGRRVRFAGGRLEYHDDVLPVVDWDFPDGPRQVVGEFSMADVVTVPSHVAVPSVRTYMSANAVSDLGAGVARGERAAESFVVDVVVRAGGAERRMFARGRDIYAVSAPLAVEAVERVLTGRILASGVASAGAMFDAVDFLGALSEWVSVG